VRVPLLLRRPRNGGSFCIDYNGSKYHGSAMLNLRPAVRGGGGLRGCGGVGGCFGKYGGGKGFYMRVRRRVMCGKGKKGREQNGGDGENGRTGDGKKEETRSKRKKSEEAGMPAVWFLARHP